MATKHATRLARQRGERGFSLLEAAVDLQDGVDPAPAACASEARKTVRFVDDGGVHVSDVALDPTAASLGVAAWQETGDRFLAWHFAKGWTIGGGIGDGRDCRFAPASVRAAIDANIAAARLDADVDGALSGRHLVVVRGSDPCPAATAPQQR